MKHNDRVMILRNSNDMYIFIFTRISLVFTMLVASRSPILAFVLRTNILVASEYRRYMSSQVALSISSADIAFRSSTSTSWLSVYR